MRRRAGRGAPQPRARVLVVDDDEHNLLAIRTVIEDLAEVEVAASGEEALRHLLKGEFAVILLDVFMTGMDGYETAQIIRGREQTKRIPIVFLSAVNKEKEHLLRGYAMGAVDYVFKPVEPVVLRSKVGGVRRPVHDAPRDRAQGGAGAAIARRQPPRQCRAAARSSRRCASPSNARRRSSARCRSSSISRSASESPRVPQFVGGNFEALTGFAFETVQRDADALGGPAASRRPRAGLRRARRAAAQRRDGGRISLALRRRPVQAFPRPGGAAAGDGRRPAEYAGTLLDVTERKALEEELLQVRKMDAIGKLTGGIAHDFNNLLAAVLGGIGLIERRLRAGRRAEADRRMTRHAAEQGAELVGRLLAFARRQKLQPGPIDLGRLSGSGHRFARATRWAGWSGWNGSRRTGVWPAYADSAQLELALMNLIINARDAMPEGGTDRCSPRRNAEARAGNAPNLAPGDYVVLTVSDSGSGIAARSARPGDRALLHHQGDRQGHRPRPVHGLWLRRASRAAACGSIRPRRGHDGRIWLPRAPQSRRGGRAAAPAARGRGRDAAAAHPAGRRS